MGEMLEQKNGQLEGVYGQLRQAKQEAQQRDFVVTPPIHTPARVGLRSLRCECAAAADADVAWEQIAEQKAQLAAWEQDLKALRHQLEEERQFARAAITKVHHQRAPPAILPPPEASRPAQLATIGNRLFRSRSEKTPR